jgi:hypothetical protein
MPTPSHRRHHHHHHHHHHLLPLLSDHRPGNPVTVGLAVVLVGLVVAMAVAGAGAVETRHPVPMLVTT